MKNTAKAIFDVRGLLTHMYYRGNDPDAIRLDNGDQVPTAGFGFSNFLDEYFLPLLDYYAPADIIVVYDGGNLYRTQLFPEYKAKRKAEREKRDPEYKKQLDLLETTAKIFLANVGCIGVNVDGVEADDVIAHICDSLSDHNKSIYTVDADLLQLADERTVVFLKNELQDDDYKGIPHDLIRLNKALCGDKSDGYLGVRRFGEAAWGSLADAYGIDGMRELDKCFQSGDFSAMEECLDCEPEPDQKSGHRALSHVYSNLEEAKLGYALASLHPELCYEFHGKRLIWPTYYVRVPNRWKAEQALVRVGCEDYLEKLEKFFPKNFLLTKENESDLVNFFLSKLSETPFFSMDYETYDTLNHKPFIDAASSTSKAKVGVYVDVLSQEITGCSINFGANRQYTIYISVFHKDTNNVDKSLVRDFLETIESTKKPLVAHNTSFEVQVTRQCLDGYVIEKPYDTIIMASYVNENEESRLKGLSSNVLNYEQKTYKETLQAAGASNMAECTGEQVMSYGCDDSLVTSRLADLFYLIMKMEGTWEFYDTNERCPVHVLCDAFETGVRIDFPKLKVQAEFHAKRIEEKMAAIRAALEKHCTMPNPAAAQALDKADGKNLMELERETGKYTDSQLKARRETKVLQWEQAAVYTPYREVVTPPQFLGTPTQLKKTLAALGAEDTDVLDSINRSKVNTFISVLRPKYEDNERIQEFLDLLGPAAAFLKKREGPEFEALAEFCLPFIGSDKVTKEGDELNFNSPKQMKELLYLKLALPVRRRTKVQDDSGRDELGLDGSPATDERAIMLAVAEDCEGDNQWKAQVLRDLIDVKESETLFSLYFNPYPNWVHPRDGMIHPQIKNCGTVTRRPSGSNPNILQVAKGPTRELYIPRYDDHVIVALDFSGQELRITGSESRDPVMIEAYTGHGTYEDDGMIRTRIKDIHSVTACSFAREILKRERMEFAEEFTYDVFMKMRKGGYGAACQKFAELCRKIAKMVNFLIIYGGAASTLAMNAGIPESLADKIMNGVFRAYRRLQPWQDETIAFGRRNGYVLTAFGTVKHLTKDIRSENGSLRSRQERQAVNQTVQGCAADILKVVLTRAYETKLFPETHSKLIAPVYDEITSSVHIRHVFEYCQRLQDIMNLTPPGHAIPMMAEVSVSSSSWGEMIELGDRPSERKILAAIEQSKRKAA